MGLAWVWWLRNRILDIESAESTVCMFSQSIPLKVCLVVTQYLVGVAMTGMDKPSETKRLLFINTNEKDFHPDRNRHKSTDSEVRRHVMRDIGRARRKPSKDLQFVTLTWQTQKHAYKQESPKSRQCGHQKTPEEYQVIRSTPTLDTLAVFEREWGEDSFSAYGFTLIMTIGKNAMSGSK